MNFSDKNRVFQVAELNLAIKNLLETNIPLLWVRGEISNLTKAASGHYYFSLKDDSAQVRCVMFRHKASAIEQPLRNGQQVEVLALASLYEARGEFQLTIEQLRLAGLGALYERFAQLKAQLAQQGLFASERKRILPVFPKRVGIVTSPQAAALRDVLSTLKRRLPSVPIILYPTPVQGTGSAEKIALAIETANQRAECGVLIVCRGGGSIEDLWAFNEEIVAHAIANSHIPIISGIGHETDFTIADFVADFRAATPTAAAQAAVQDRIVLLKNLQQKAAQLQRAQQNRVAQLAQTVDYLQRRLVHPAQKIAQQKQQTEQLHYRLSRATKHILQQANWRQKSLQQRLVSHSNQLNQLQNQQQQLATRLIQHVKNSQQQRLTKLEQLAQQLTLLNPHNVLNRGYSLVQDSNGNILTEASQTKPGDNVRITFAQGRIEATVKSSTSKNGVV